MFYYSPPPPQPRVPNFSPFALQPSVLELQAIRDNYTKWPQMTYTFYHYPQTSVQFTRRLATFNIFKNFCFSLATVRNLYLFFFSNILNFKFPKFEEVAFLWTVTENTYNSLVEKSITVEGIAFLKIVSSENHKCSEWPQNVLEQYRVKGTLISSTNSPDFLISVRSLGDVQSSR